MSQGKHGQASKWFGSAGFYIALLLCVLVLMVVGWLLLAPEPQQSQPVVVDKVEPAKPVAQPPQPPRPRTELPKPAVRPVIQSEQPVMPEVPVVPEKPAVQPQPVEVDELTVLPLAGEILTAFSGEELVFNETTADWRTHGGIDIAAQAGASVVAARGGTVLSVGEDPRLGVTVVVDHGEGLETVYAGLKDEVLVAQGEKVKAGQVVGAVGNTTLTETAMGPHLHFAVRLDGVAMDPEDFLQGE